MASLILGKRWEGRQRGLRDPRGAHTVLSTGYTPQIVLCHNLRHYCWMWGQGCTSKALVMEASYVHFPSFNTWRGRII